MSFDVDIKLTNSFFNQVVEDEDFKYEQKLNNKKSYRKSAHLLEVFSAVFKKNKTTKTNNEIVDTKRLSFISGKSNEKTVCALFFEGMLHLFDIFQNSKPCALYEMPRKELLSSKVPLLIYNIDHTYKKIYQQNYTTIFDQIFHWYLLKKNISFVQKPKKLDVCREEFSFELKSWSLENLIKLYFIVERRISSDGNRKLTDDFEKIVNSLSKNLLQATKEIISSNQGEFDRNALEQSISVGSDKFTILKNTEILKVFISFVCHDECRSPDEGNALKLILDYEAFFSDFEEKNIQGESIKERFEEIIKTLDTLNLPGDEKEQIRKSLEELSGYPQNAFDDLKKEIMNQLSCNYLDGRNSSSFASYPFGMSYEYYEFLLKSNLPIP